MRRTMYNWEKSLREDKMRKNPKNPSFSSTLLDEIYREIDGGEELIQPKEKSVKKHISTSNNGGGRENARSSIEDEEMASFRRACLIEKWMEKKVNEKVLAGRGSLFPEFDHRLMQDNDPLFFSSSSSYSDSSFGGFSSSETESLAVGKSRTSCFATPRPKPVRTSVQFGKLEHPAVSHEQGEFYLFDDYRLNNHQTNKTKGLIKSKSRALKIYHNLKKVKQPISPGGRLSSFINNLFANGNPKKNKDLHPNGNGGYNVDRKTQTSSTCSSASSFSRFYLSKNSPNSEEKLNNVNKRTVEDSRRCGHKSIYDEDFERFGMPMLPQTNGDQPISPPMDRKNQEKNEFQIRDEEDYDDEASDSSSDLFELDHLAFFKNDKFFNDLPVYETTNLGMNRAIASGLVR